MATQALMLCLATAALLHAENDVAREQRLAGIPDLRRGSRVGDRFVPSEAEFPVAVYELWNVLDRFAVARNFGCVDKSPATNPKSLCLARSDRFNPYVLGYMRPAQMMSYARHVRARAAQTYCEIGMNAGHGTVAVLLAREGLRVHSFDLREWKYSDAVAQLLSELFPGRFTSYQGSSFDTVPAYAQDPANPRCDAALIDGLHTRAGAARDLHNMRAAMACDHVLFIDDLQSEVGGVVDAMVAAGDLEILERQSFAADDPATCLRVYDRVLPGPGERRWWPTAMMPVEDVEKRWTLVEKCNVEPFSFAVGRYLRLPQCGRE